MTGHPLPTWTEGRPPKPGMYFGFSDAKERFGDKPSLYHFDGKVFQHWTGWYDHAITHWMATDLPEGDSA